MPTRPDPERGDAERLLHRREIAARLECALRQQRELADVLYNANVEHFRAKTALLAAELAAAAAREVLGRAAFDHDLRILCAKIELESLDRKHPPEVADGSP